jgi:hypothetical protein
MPPFQVTQNEGFPDIAPKPEDSYICSSTGDIKVFLSHLETVFRRRKCGKNSQQIIAFTAHLFMLTGTLPLASCVVIFWKVNVAKSLVFNTIVLAVLLSIGGCSTAESEVERDALRFESAVSFHDKCADTLEAFVNSQGMVDYRRLKRKRDELRLLLGQLVRLDPDVYKSWPEADKIAYWINLYNLQKLKVIVDNYPITPSSRILAAYWGPLSVRHIEGKIAAHRFGVMGEQFTFAQIERRVFGEQFDDPRIFFALSSASISSPPLRNEPYYGYKLNKQLDDQIRRFLSNPLVFKVDREKKIVYLAAIFELSSRGKEIVENYAAGKKFKDHPPATRAALNFISDYISRQDRSFLEMGEYSVKYMKHDWTINDIS